MKKPPLLPYSPYRKYTGEELESLYQKGLAINYSREDIVREAEQIKKRLQELRDRWKFLGQEKKQIREVLDEHNFGPRRFRL